MTHIEKEHIEPFGSEEDSLAIMFCGATVVLYPDGGTNPTGFDFYLAKDGHKASCKPCKNAMLLKTEVSLEVTA